MESDTLHIKGDFLRKTYVIITLTADGYTEKTICKLTLFKYKIINQLIHFRNKTFKLESFNYNFIECVVNYPIKIPPNFK